MSNCRAGIAGRRAGQKDTLVARAGSIVTTLLAAATASTLSLSLTLSSESFCGRIGLGLFPPVQNFNHHLVCID